MLRLMLAVPALLLGFNLGAEAKVPLLEGTYSTTERVEILGRTLSPSVRLVFSGSVPMIADCNFSGFCNTRVYGTQEVNCSAGANGRCEVLANSGAEVRYDSETGSFTLRYVYLNSIYHMVDEILTLTVNRDGEPALVVPGRKPVALTLQR